MTEDDLDDLEADIDRQAQHLHLLDRIEHLELVVRRARSLRYLAHRECVHWRGLLSRSRHRPRLCRLVEGWLADAQLNYRTRDCEFLERTCALVEALGQLAESEESEE